MALRLLLVFIVEHYVLDCHSFLDINVSHGSVTTRFGCGGIFNDDCITNLLLNPLVEKF